MVSEMLRISFSISSWWRFKLRRSDNPLSVASLPVKYGKLLIFFILFHSIGVVGIQRVNAHTCYPRTRKGLRSFPIPTPAPWQWRLLVRNAKLTIVVVVEQIFVTAMTTSGILQVVMLAHYAHLPEPIFPVASSQKINKNLSGRTFTSHPIHDDTLRVLSKVDIQPCWGENKNF